MAKKRRVVRAGLNNPVNKRWIHSLLQKDNVDVMCIKETHLQGNETKYLGEVFLGLWFHAAAPVKKRGVCLGISKKLHWEVDVVFKDMDGYFLILKRVMYGLKWTLVGIYAPQSGRGILFSKLIDRIDQLAEGILILIGDFNAVMEVSLDKSTQRSSHSVLLPVFKNWLKRNGVIDVWREYNHTVHPMESGGSCKEMCGMAMFPIISCLIWRQKKAPLCWQSGSFSLLWIHRNVHAT